MAAIESRLIPAGSHSVCVRAERIAARPGGRKNGAMRLLILGGTVFLGRAIATAAVAAGHDVTCAARGTSGAVPAGARLVPVDRSVPGALAAVEGAFDAVIDVARQP